MLFEVLIELYYRLSGARSLNLMSASTLLINQLFADCPETPFLRERAKRVLGRALLVSIERHVVWKNKVLFNDIDREIESILFFLF